MAEVDSNLVEWNYGEYEGRRTAEIRAERPGWELFRDGSPGGESPAQVMARADNVWSRVRDVKGNVLLFSSGHFIRVLAARAAAHFHEADVIMARNPRRIGKILLTLPRAQ